jgi:hypothetical protein
MREWDSYRVDKSGKIVHIVHDRRRVADVIFETYQREAAGTEVPLFQRRALKAVGRL